MPDKLIAAARTSSKGSSLRITLPKEVAEKLNVSESEHIGFYEEEGKLRSGRLNRLSYFLIAFFIESFNRIRVHLSVAL